MFFASNYKPLSGKKYHNAIDFSYLEQFEKKSFIKKMIASFLLFKRYDGVVLYQPGLELFFLSLISIFGKKGDFNLVVVDHQFSPEVGGWYGIKAFFWRKVWENVDLVVGHMAYQERLYHLYGITEKNYVRMDYKVNGYEELGSLPVNDGDYIFSGGYSWRDYNVFIESMRRNPDVQAKIVTLIPESAKKHGTDSGVGDPPSNVEVVYHNKNVETWRSMLAGCRFVVVPIHRNVICSNGISVCLSAMALGKHVIITRSPAVDGIYTHGEELTIVEPNDIDAMTQAISKVNRDEKYRQRVAVNGRRVAMATGGVDCFAGRLACVVGDSLVRSYQDER